MSDIGILVSAVAIVFLSLAIFITLFIINYQRRQLNFKKTTEAMKARFQHELLQSQLEIQEQTFTTISQEIHDNVGQSLSLAKMQLHLLDRGEEYNKKLIADTTESVSKAIADLRDIARSLHSARIEQSTLHSIISQELLRISHSGLLQTHIETGGDIKVISDQKKLIVFRIVQEALQNILKHASASVIEVKCVYGNEHLSISISDNGKGFDKQAPANKDGLGLLNIINRAELIGGNASVNSIISKGTTVHISTPYA